MTNRPATTPQPIPYDLERHQLLDLYYYMRLTRTLEERIVTLKRQGKVVSGVYRSLGQEADAVGSAYALDRSSGDMLCPLIRNLGSVLVQGATPLEILRQNLARETSPTGGRELLYNFADLKRGFIPHISNLGDMVSVMAGVALSFTIRGEQRVAMVYAGDGSTSTGAFHEGLNLAGVQHVPLVVVVESNHYAYSTPSRLQFAVKDLAKRALAYGVPAVVADGNDVLAVYGVTRDAVRRARNGGGVTFIELKTYRRTGHAEHDNQRYVPKGELEHWEALDPLTSYRKRLTVGSGWIENGELDRVDERVIQEVDAAVAGALGEPSPQGSSALKGICVDPPVSPQLWFRDA